MNTAQRIEQVLNEARRQLLDFAQEVGQGKWVGRESEAAIRAGEISEEIGKATALLFATDGTGQVDTLLSRLQ